MAERRRLPVSELDPESTTSPVAKRSKVSEKEGEGGEEEEEDKEKGDLMREKSVERSLETTEKLPSTESSSSSEEGNRHRIVIREAHFSLSGSSRDVLPGTSSSSRDEETELDISTKQLTSRIMGRGRDETREQQQQQQQQQQQTGDKSSLIGEHAHYEEISLIGDGAYGTVYKAKDLTSGQVVALKKVRVPLTEDGLPTSTLREIAGLKQLERFEHPHIVRLLDVCQGNYLKLPAQGEPSGRVDRGLTLWLVFEHVERDLASYIASCSKTTIDAQQVRRMSREILLGVDFLHSHRIVHRDLKPQNLLVTREGRIKIADFGLAKTYDFEMRLTSVVVTLWYRAPEVLLGCPYATPIDLWSVGCIMAEISRLQPLFPGTSEGDQLDRIFQIIGTPSQEDWPENVSLSWTAFPHRQPKPLRSLIPSLDDQGLDLMKQLLTFDPHVRLTAAQALNHQYFANFES